MFTGIVEELGKVLALKEKDGGTELEVQASLLKEGNRLGDSIAVNGVCLTITRLDKNTATFGLAPETLKRTNLGDLNTGDKVDLERALLANGRLGGHFVQGHIDGTGKVTKRTPEGDSLVIEVETPKDILALMVPKGFIAVDGTSLTLIDVTETAFTFMLVAYTQSHVVLPLRNPGDRVNLEVDILAKYAQKFMGASGGSGGFAP